MASVEVTTTSQPRESGVAKLKQEFLLLDYKRTLISEYVSKSVKAEMEAQKLEDSKGTDGQPPSKKIKLTGRNKQRPRGKKIDPGEKICPTVIRGEECSYGENCKFSHDKAKFMAEKEKDIGEDCYMFNTYGKCPYGLACRFSSKHITADFQNIVNKEVVSQKTREATVCNLLTKDVQVQLWKKKYDFSKANEVLNKICPDRYKGKGSKKVVTEKQTPASQTHVKNEVSPVDGNKPETDVPVSPNGITYQTEQSTSANSSVDCNCDGKPNVGEKTVAVNIGSNAEPEVSGGQQKVVTLEEEGIIRLRPHEKKKVNFENKLYLAPLTTVGNLPFRRICKRLGADITCGEMAVGSNLLQGKAGEWALLKRHESEDLFGVQICGAYPDIMTRCAQMINDCINVDFVDINCGCPIDLIFHKGEGCALMGRHAKFEQIVHGMTSVLDVPLTVKMRTGIYGSQSIAHNLVPKLRDWGVALTTIHGRSREQRYTKSANWDYINECAQLAAPMPLFGNGDVLSYHEYNQRMRDTDVSGLMLARGALIKPWIFTEIKEQRDWDISSGERLDLLKDYVNYGLEHWGSDRQGVETTRRFLLEWLSFLHRYIPVGILECPPQKINERPPYYKGRDDLETMMSSPSCDDWIKISEMLLGPVPGDFSFLPKHKANAYK